jgi:para-nitrobenzyl esterase
VVTPTFRLGALGFFAHPKLPGSGAFALQDQQAALRWVRRNAAAFGGDPRNVTLIGESSGGVSVCGQLTSPAAAGLFDKAVIQSGSCLLDFPPNALGPQGPAHRFWVPRDTAEKRGVQAANQLGCAPPADVPACLRRIPAPDLLALNRDFSQAVSGTPALPLDPARALHTGRFHRTPVLQGGTRDENRLYGVLFQLFDQPITARRYRELLTEAFGDRAGQVAARYPASRHGSPALAWSAVVTDHAWACPTLASDRLLARHVPLYAYEFADRHAPDTTGWFGDAPDFPPGAYHSSELAYLFDLDEKLTPSQQRLSELMVVYWTRFAHTGQPGTPGLAPWAAFRSADPVPYVQSLAPGRGGIRPVNFAAAHQCDFWSAIAAGD